MKRIEELTAKEKYEILIKVDAEKDFSPICFRIQNWFDKIYRTPYSVRMIQTNFEMSIIKPKLAHLIWWEVGDPAREVAWQKLIEYWKEQAENEPA